MGIKEQEQRTIENALQVILCNKCLGDVTIVCGYYGIDKREFINNIISRHCNKLIEDIERENAPVDLSVLDEVLKI